MAINQSNSDKRTKKKYWWLLLVLLLLIGGIVGYQYFTQQPKEIVAGSFLPEGKDSKRMSEKERKKAAAKAVDASKFTLSIYPEATFETGTSSGNIFIRNETVNAYPISVEVVRDDTGETIYESGGIKPGYEVTEGKLKKALPKGMYKCTAKVAIYDPKTKAYKGQTAASMKIEVKA